MEELAVVGIAEKCKVSKRKDGSVPSEEAVDKVARILLKIQWLVGREREQDNHEATRTTTMTTTRLKGIQLG